MSDDNRYPLSSVPASIVNKLPPTSDSPLSRKAVRLPESPLASNVPLPVFDDYPSDSESESEVEDYVQLPPIPAPKPIKQRGSDSNKESQKSSGKYQRPVPVLPKSAITPAMEVFSRPQLHKNPTGTKEVKGLTHYTSPIPEGVNKTSKHVKADSGCCIIS